MTWTAVVPLIGIIVAPLLTYLVARRRSSGRIDTTEAATLWTEAEKLRKLYQDEAERLRKELTGVQEQLATLSAEITVLRKEIAIWQDKAAALQVQVEKLNKRLEDQRD